MQKSGQIPPYTSNKQIQQSLQQSQPQQTYPYISGQQQTNQSSVQQPYSIVQEQPPYTSSKMQQPGQQQAYPSGQPNQQVTNVQPKAEPVLIQAEPA